jgi:hypothetical protein
MKDEKTVSSCSCGRQRALTLSGDIAPVCTLADMRSREQSRANDVIEFICVVIVVLAVVALGVWIASTAGGGVLNQG